MLDILIVIGPKDYSKLKWVVRSAMINIKDGIENIYVISPTDVPWEDDDLPHIYNFTDEYMQNLLDFDKNEIKDRKNWISQQFFKFFPDFMPHGEYLIVDSDCLFCNPINIYQNGKPSFFHGIDQNHEQYFNFQKSLLGFDKVYDKSFICEFFLIRKHIIQDMLNRNSLTPQTFVRKSIDILNSDTNCHIGEPELYGNYVAKYFPDEYMHRNLRTTLYGKQIEPWTDKEIQQAFIVGQRSNNHTVTIHTWDAAN